MNSVKPSITTQITRALTAMICVAVTLAAIAAYGVYRKMEGTMLNNLVQTEANRLESRLSRFGGAMQSPFERDMGPSMFAWGESPNFVSEALPPELRKLPLGLHLLARETGQWHVYVTNLLDGRLYVLYDSIVLEQQARHFAIALAMIVLLFALLAVLVSHRVARWITQPINTLTERLARWAPGQPQQGAGPAHEADRLMDAFNRVQAQVDARFADQREFSANLHHEIRTPLTVIRSDAELLLRLQPSAEPRVVERLKRIVMSVEEITQSLESTYSLAHAGNGVAESVNLRSCVQDIVDSLQWDAVNQGLIIHNQVQAQQDVVLVRHALMTVVRNIVRNAIAHASPAILEIQSSEDGLVFLDTGPGIDPQEQMRVFERYFSTRRKDSGGQSQSEDPLLAQPNWEASGLGLAIAKRVCDIQHWQLAVISPMDQQRGTCFIVCFDAHAALVGSSGRAIPV